MICTSDKDARQLIDEKTRVLNIRKGEFLDRGAAKADWGVRPDQVIDTLALTGDAVDNVPGVPGIGLKTAVGLLQQYETIEGIYANIAKVSGAKRKENLLAHRDTLRQGRELITLETALPIELDWEALKSDGYDATALRALCVECGFHRFLDEIVETGQGRRRPPGRWTTGRSTRRRSSPSSWSSWRSSPATASTPRPRRSTRSRANLVGLSFAWEPGVAYYLPVRGPMGSTVLDEQATLAALRPSLTDPTPRRSGRTSSTTC